jgi:hypothetical protein
MLDTVCGKRSATEILAIFNEVGLKGYTVISAVGGRGMTGTVSGPDISTDESSVIRSALSFLTQDDRIISGSMDPSTTLQQTGLY